MNEITLIVGAKENMETDIRTVALQRVKDPEVVMVEGQRTRIVVTEKASSLFLNPNLVLVLVDPDLSTLRTLKGQLDDLKGRIHVLVYTASPPPDELKQMAGDIITMDRDKGGNLKKRVLSLLKLYEKRMTDKAFETLMSRIKDESILEQELMKVINYCGGRTKIDSKDIQAIVVQTHEDTLVTLFEAMASWDKQEMLSVFENLMANGLHILAIHSYLVRQIRLLLQAKDMEELFKANPQYPVFAKTFGKWKEDLEIKPSEKKHYFPYQKPYYAYKLSKASQKMAKQSLVSLLDKLAEFDASVKKGTRYERTNLELALLDV